MAQNSKEIELQFPLKGLDENWSYRKQLQGTSPSLLNVRPYDAIEGRARGGQRPGIKKYLADAINGSNAIQQIDQLTVAFDSSSVIAGDLLDSDDFEGTPGDLLSVHNADWTDTNVTLTSANGGPEGLVIAAGGSSCIVSDTSTTSGYGAIHNVSVGTAYVIRASITQTLPGFSNNTQGIIAFRLDDLVNANQEKYEVVLKVNDSSTDTWTLTLRSINSSGTPTTVGDYLLQTGGISGGVTAVIEVRMSGNVCQVLADGVIRIIATITSYSDKSGIGLVCSQGSGTGDSDHTEINYFEIYDGKVPSTLRSTELMVISGGDIFSIDGEGVSSEVGSSSVKSSGRVMSQAAYQKMYFCDGLVTGYKVYNPVTRSVDTWVTTEGKGSLPVGGGSGQTSYDVTDITAGGAGAALIEINSTEGDVSADFSDGDIVEVRDTSLGANNRSYTVASAAHSGNTTITIDELVKTSSTGGTLRIGDEACTIIALYRGRVVMSGLASDPHNWFMSRSGNPLDFDYFPATITATMPVAGNNTEAGLLGDVITCLAPYSDELMVIGGDHTLWVMRGDPAAGGIIDNVSYQTGIAGPRAYAWTPNGTMYFLGANTLWRMGADLAPEPVSRGRIDATMATIDLSVYEVHMAWDSKRHGLHIFLVPQSQPATAPIHIWYDERTDSFWKDQFPAVVGPTVAHVYDADDPNDRALLLGSWDSYIRTPSDSTKDDDGTVINSYVMYTPLVQSDSRAFRLDTIRTILDTSSDAVRLELHAGETAEAVAQSSSAAWTQALAAGRNPPIYKRARGNAIAIRLENDAVTAKQWAVETISAMLTPVGRIRHGRL